MPRDADATSFVTTSRALGLPVYRNRNLEARFSPDDPISGSKVAANAGISPGANCFTATADGMSQSGGAGGNPSKSVNRPGSRSLGGRGQ